MAALNVRLHRRQAFAQVRGHYRDGLLSQGVEAVEHRLALRVVGIEVGQQYATSIIQCLVIDLGLAIERSPLRLLDGQAQGQAQLVQLLASQQRPHIVVSVEVDLEVLGDFCPPLRQAAGPITVGRQRTERIGVAGKFRRLGAELLHQLALGGEFEEQTGAVRLLGTVERGQAARQLLAGGKSARVALFTEDFVGAFDQGLGAGDVLQRRQAQGSQAQQVLGLGQAPLLAAFAEYGFQTLAQTLLVALQLRHQAATVFQLTGGRQAGQLCTDLLLTLLQCRGALVEGFKVLTLTHLTALQLPHLPDTPTPDCDPGRTQQQRQHGRPLPERFTGLSVTGCADACADG